MCEISHIMWQICEIRAHYASIIDQIDPFLLQNDPFGFRMIHFRDILSRFCIICLEFDPNPAILAKFGPSLSRFVIITG